MGLARGFAVTENLRDAIALVPNKVRTPAIDADGGIREGGDVAELTGLIDPGVLANWPAGMRVIVRRERPHPGAQLSLFEERDGWRYQALITNTPDHPGTGTLAFLEARHRAHARVEDRIRYAKDSGLGRFPSREFAINQAWLTLTMIAADLTAWTRLLGCHGDAKNLPTCEPKALRYRFLHVPARLTHSARRRRLRIPKTCPGPQRSSPCSPTSPRSPNPPDPPRPPTTRGTRSPAHRQRQPDQRRAHKPATRSLTQQPRPQNPMNHRG